MTSREILLINILQVLQKTNRQRSETLDNLDFGAADSFTSIGLFVASNKGDDAVTSGMHRVVGAHHGAFARDFGHTDLAEDNLADFNSLATRLLKPEALAGRITVIFTGSARFDV